MKNDPTRTPLKKREGPPLYQCPNCRTKWLIIGLEQLREHTCKVCSHRFDPAESQFTIAGLASDNSRVRADAA